MELLFGDSIFLSVNFLFLEEIIKPQFTHPKVYERKFWFVVVMRYRRTRRPAMFSATVQDFLPYKLEPLGLSSSGQLRVAP